MSHLLAHLNNNGSCMAFSLLSRTNKYAEPSTTMNTRVQRVHFGILGRIAYTMLKCHSRRRRQASCGGKRLHARPTHQRDQTQTFFEFSFFDILNTPRTNCPSIYTKIFVFGLIGRWSYYLQRERLDKQLNSSLIRYDI